MEAFDTAWARTLDIERGFAMIDGGTRYGITAQTARAHGYMGEMRDFPIEMAKSIAKEYWDAVRGDQLAEMSFDLAFVMFDINFNMWGGAAARFLQRASNALGGALLVDGVLGSGTVAFVAEYFGRIGHGRTRQENERVLLLTVEGLRVADYVRQVLVDGTKQTNFYGWVSKRGRLYADR